MLATVLVLMFVLTISAIGGAMLARSNISSVNSGYAERRAFYIAEAGIAEALVRLRMSTATTTTVDGQTFDASFSGANAPDTTQTGWQAQILFSGTGPVKSGTTVTTPTLQPASSRLLYSTASSGSDTLKIGWELVGGAIRRVGGKKVLTITSTGRAGLASRTILERVAVNDMSAVVLRTDTCPGIRTQGSGAVAFVAAVHVNTTSSCATSVAAGGSSAISAGGPISVSGTGYSGSVTPVPSTGIPPVADPLASLAVPSFAGRTTRWGSVASPTTYQPAGLTTIHPGIYYGGIRIGSGDNITMDPGVYIMAGGGFQVVANGMVTGPGVMIYNTCAVPPPAGIACALTGNAGYGAIDVSANLPLTLTAQTSTGPEPIYAGIAMFQDRMNATAISFTAGATGVIDGLIYAPMATISMFGNADLLHSQLVVGAIDLHGGPQIGSPSDWVPLGGARVQPISWQDF